MRMRSEVGTGGRVEPLRRIGAAVPVGRWCSGAERDRRPGGGARHHGPLEGAVVAEAIERIRSAEQEAEELGRAARAQGKALGANAHGAAERSLDDARKAGWEEEKTLRAAAAREAEGEAEKLIAESRSSVQSVRASAEQRVEDGIKKVLELITATADATRG